MAPTERQLAWDMYFSSAVGMSLHPGAGTKDHKALSISECAELADKMLRERDTRKETLCE